MMAREIVGGALVGVGGSGRGRRSGSVGETQRRLRRLLIAASGREGPRSTGREVAEEGGRAPAFVPVSGEYEDENRKKTRKKLESLRNFEFSGGEKLQNLKVAEWIVL